MFNGNCVMYNLRNLTSEYFIIIWFYDVLCGVKARHIYKNYECLLYISF